MKAKFFQMTLVVGLFGILAQASGVRRESPVKQADLHFIFENGRDLDLPSKTLTMYEQLGDRFKSRPNAFLLGEEIGIRCLKAPCPNELATRFEIIAQSDVEGSVLYQAQKQTPRGVRILHVVNHSSNSGAMARYQWMVTIIDEDGNPEKFGGNPFPVRPIRGGR